MSEARDLTADTINWSRALITALELISELSFLGGGGVTV